MNDNTVYVDAETQSEQIINQVGAHRYIYDESTLPICLAYKGRYDGDWVDSDLLTVPDLENGFHGRAKWLYKRAADPKMFFCAHNAPFEIYFWQKFMVEWYDFPEIHISRWRCTMAKAYAHGLPPSLEDMGAALQLSSRKDSKAKDKVKYLWSPKTKGGSEFWAVNEKPEDYKIMYDYCVQDLEPCIEADLMLRNLSPTEQKVWELDNKINQYGIRVDVPLLDKAQALIAEQKAIDVGAFFDTTGDKLTRERFKKWLSKAGFPLPNAQKATLDKFLLRTDLPPDVRSATLNYKSAGKTSLAKYATMQRQRDDYGIIRDGAQYHGAHTGRWGGRGVQWQNLPRPLFDVQTVCDIINTFGFEAFTELYDDVTGALSSGIRGMVIPRPGNRLLVGDFKQMEARVLCWLAKQFTKLGLYIQGFDPYCYAASPIFGREITKADKNERQVGKVSELALGYGGGIGAYAKMAEQYKIDLSGIYRLLWNTATAWEMELAEISYVLYLQRCATNKVEPVPQEIAFVSDLVKQRWRKKNPEVVRYWTLLEDAAIDAMLTKKPVRADDVVFFQHKQFLFCRLPSGRDIAYPYPRLHEGKRGGIRLEYMTNDKARGGWVRDSTYGGKLAENVTQASQRDLLSEAMIRLDADGYDLSIHVHDEAESDTDHGTLEDYERIMSIQPVWAVGLPIGVDAWEGMRYDKRG